MEVRFKVHGQADVLIPVKASVAGEEMVVQTKGVEVELTSVDPRHGSLVLRFVGKEADEARHVKTWTLVSK